MCNVFSSFVMRKEHFSLGAPLFIFGCGGGVCIAKFNVLKCFR
jgi:hypothetical protein